MSRLESFNQSNPGETYKLGSLIQPPAQVSGDGFGANIQLSGPPEFPARPTSVAGALMQAGPDDREAIGEALGRILSFRDATNAGIDPGLESQQRQLLAAQQERLRWVPEQPIDIYQRIDPTPINARHLMELAFLSARKPAVNPIAEPTPFPIPVPQNLPIPFPVGGGFPVPPPGGGPTGATGGNVNIKIGGSTATSGRYGGGSIGGNTYVNNNGGGYQRNPNYGGNQGGGTQQPPSAGGGGTQPPGYGGGNTGGGGGYPGGGDVGFPGTVLPGGAWMPGLTLPPPGDPNDPDANPPTGDNQPWWLSYVKEEVARRYMAEVNAIDSKLKSGEIDPMKAAAMRAELDMKYGQWKGQ